VGLVLIDTNQTSVCPTTLCADPNIKCNRNTFKIFGDIACILMDTTSSTWSHIVQFFLKKTNRHLLKVLFLWMVWHYLKEQRQGTGTDDFLHESERARAGSRGGEESFVPRDGWVSPAPQSNLNPPTSNGCSASPCTYRVEINLPRTAAWSSVQLQFWPLYLTPLAFNSHLQNVCLSPGLNRPTVSILSTSLAGISEGSTLLIPAAGHDPKPLTSTSHP
jgi:hypothetical protein